MTIVRETVTELYVHGGVSGIVESPPSLGHALRHAHESTSPLDAVEAAVRALEDDPALNAGYGAVLNRDGELELDAGIADGRSGRCAGVANVTVRHPISLARKVLTETPHVLVTGSGARALGAGMELLEDTTPAQRERWERSRAAGGPAPEQLGEPEPLDTVGAVALVGGGLAAASSTGGVFGKMPGRVGDSPILGAGIFASGQVAVVGTGVGELFLETLACARAARLVEAGRHPQAACEAVIAHVGTRRPTSAGLLALDAAGRVGVAFRGRSWAVEGAGGPVGPRRIG